MTMILIPVLLAVLLGPGLGQLYNKDFKKGFILIALSVGVLLAFSVWLFRAAMVHLPSDMNTVDRALLRDIIQKHIITEHRVTYYAYQIILAGLWIYGIVDAYLGGVRRRNSQAASPTPPEGGSN